MTSKGTSCEEAGGEAVLAFDPLSIDDMSAALDRIVQDGDLRQTMVKKGKERAKVFSPDLEMPNLEQAYKEAILKTKSS